VLYATVIDKLKSYKLDSDFFSTIFLLPEGAMRDIYDCIVDNRLVSCLELGSGHGATSCVIGAAVAETGGQATTIDMCLHQPANAKTLKEHVGLGSELEVVIDPLGYNWWLADLLKKQLVDGVYQPLFDFVFLDGAHEWQPDALAAQLAVHLLKPGGWLVLDDLNFVIRSMPRWKDSHGHLSDRELDSYQVGMVWDLVIRQHAELEKFRVTECGRVGWARKVAGAPAPRRDARVVYENPKGVLGPISGGLTLSQSFMAEKNGLRRVDVMMATYARVNDSHLQFALRRATGGKVITSYSVPAERVKDNAWHTFEFPPVADSAGQAFVFELSAPAATPANAVTAYFTDPPSKECQLWLSGSVQRDTALLHRPYYAPRC
jgi:SAM-dependent methyltransferase